MRNRLFVLMFLFFSGIAFTQNIRLQGKVIDDKGHALAGAGVKLKRAGLDAVAANDGSFLLLRVVLSASDLQAAENRVEVEAGELWVSVAAEQEMSVRVLDLRQREAGRYHAVLEPGKYVLSVADWAALKPGIYFLSIRLGKETFLRRYVSIGAGAPSGAGLRPMPALAKTAAALDSLEVSKAGYITRTVGVDAYSGALPDVALQPVGYTLQIDIVPPGSGTVAKSPDQALYPSGTAVSLMATPASGYAFHGWGKSYPGANPLPINLDSNKHVTAVFLPIPALAGSAAADSVISLSWTFEKPANGGLGTLSSADGWEVWESTTGAEGSFTNLNQGVPDGNRVQGSAASLHRNPGTYYYKVRGFFATDPIAGFTPYSNVITVTVEQQYATLRIINNTHYDMIDIRLGGTAKVAYPKGILPRNSAEWRYTSGTLSYVLGVGVYSNQSPQIFFTLTGTVKLTEGSVTEIVFDNPTIGQLLSNFSASRDWKGTYYDAYANAYTADYRFSSSGSWSFYDMGVFKVSGTVSLISWPDYATIVSFSLCPGCATIETAYPFNSFLFHNGPESWPLIEYDRQ